MNYSCAAGHLCGMPTRGIDSVLHRCMNCNKPMHGALCGALFAEKPPSIVICKEVMSPSGQQRYNSQSALICGVCIKNLNGATLKSPIQSVDQHAAAAATLFGFKDPTPVPMPTSLESPSPARVEDHRPAESFRYSDDADDFVQTTKGSVDSDGESSEIEMCGVLPAPSVADDLPVRIVKKRKLRPPTKKRDIFLYSHFTITKIGNGCISAVCNKCPYWNKPQLSSFNATKARLHLVNECPGVNQAVRKKLVNGSQVTRTTNKLFCLTRGPVETLSDMRSVSVSSSITQSTPESSCIDLTSPGTKAPPPRRRTARQPRGPVYRPRNALDSNQFYGPVLTEPEAETMILAEVKSMLARGETLNRLLDPYVIQSLCMRHAGLGKFIPRDEETIYRKYVIPIDVQGVDTLEEFLCKLPGHINVGMDGATVNSKQKVCCSVKAMFAFAFHQ